MRAVDVRNLVRFNTRMGMYICPSDRSGVVAFLHGYEYGAGGECRFTAILSEHLAKRHRVKSSAMGWPEQISRLAERRSLDWMEVYLLASSEVLSAAAEGQDAEPNAAADRPRE
jgi:hypothetical protein